MPIVARAHFVPSLRSVAAAAVISLLAGASSAQTPAQAEMYYKHRLVEDAKRTAIQALFQTTDAEVQVRCKDLLARIAMDENRASDAVELWQDIAKNHPDTPAATTAVQLLQQWATLARTAQAPTPGNARVATWFSAAAFWVGDIPRQPRIDTAWLDQSEAAEFWLRKIVAGYPGTADAEEALASIVRLHLGSESTATSRGHGAWGIAESARSGNRARPRHSFEEHMAKAEAALGELKAAFPQSTEVPRLQFLTAHVYWVAGDEERSRPWLIKVSEEAKVETLWAQLARLRLKNWRS
jgi:hypothetical protein